ncbi:MAG: translation initiation factor eIF-1A [Methanosarcinales archaeon]|nr:translation initiation factor eIF-1A [Methanosarcinales archaeon]MCK4651809.1 translation initiation factor eIF-1A [Methanosarcinales archaeon]MCK4811425.1 translation initiation factor eIF-1A [Methanosarcinales archaeon]
MEVLYLGKQKKPEAPIGRVRTPRKHDREILATVEKLLGANHLRVRCIDGTVRTARIPGRMKKRIWIRENDIVIIVPWDFQDAKADVIWRYTAPQVDWLRRRGYLS